MLNENQLKLLRHLSRFNLLDYPSCLDMLNNDGGSDRTALSYVFRPLTKNRYVSKDKRGCVSILAKGRALFPELEPLLSAGGGEQTRQRIMEVSCMAALMGRSGILILSPILYPIVRAYGVGDVHFGLIMVVNMAIGFITPPVGCNLFIASGMTNTKFTDLCKSIVPFIIIMFTALLIITYIPAVVEWLPSILGMLS